MLDIAQLNVQGAIFHQIPRKRPRPGSTTPVGKLVLSTGESRLEGRLPVFLRDRLNTTFGEAAQPILPDPSSDSSAPSLIEACLRDRPDHDIVTPSRPLAELLLETQADISPEGVFSMLRGQIGSRDVVAVMKVEQERGLSYETTIDGNEVRVDLVIEDSLVLTDKTTVFKAAIFYLQEDKLHGYLTDEQTGTMYRGPSSLFWIFDFLGCRYAREADVLTRAWIKATEEAIRNDLDDAADKDAAFDAMQVELRSHRNVVDPRDFIEQHFPDRKQDAAWARMERHGVHRQFPKSRDVAESAPSYKTYEWGGVTVKVRENAATTVEVHTEDDGAGSIDVMTLRGKLRRVR